MLSSITSKNVGENNSIIIMNYVLKNSPITRKQLVNETEFSTGTISNHVNNLIDKGFIEETEKGYSSGGRKPIYIEVVPDRAFMVSINIEVNQTNIYIYNLCYERIAEKSFDIVKGKPRVTLQKIKHELEEIIKGRVIEDNISGIGISVPGLVEKEKGSCVLAPNLKWNSVNLRKFFNNELSYHPVYIENEAKAAALAEKKFEYPGVDSMVYISANEGIGCGIVVGGDLIRGESGNAGEFGHIKVSDEGYPCHCGNRGCWEAEASERFLLKRYRELSSGGNITLPEFYNQFYEKEKYAVDVMDEAAYSLGKGVANIINSLNPELIVIGGGITRASEEIYDKVDEVIEDLALDLLYKNTEMKFSKLKKEAANLGMAWQLKEYGLMRELT